MDEEIQEEIQEEIPETGSCSSDCCKKPALIHVIAALVLLGLIAVVVVGFVRYNQLGSELESVQQELDGLTALEVEETVEELDEVADGLQTINLVQGLQLDIPSEWTVLSISEDEIEILTGTDPYITIETIKVLETELPEAVPAFYETDDLSLYNLGCAPAIGCYIAEVDNMIYSFSWGMVQGTEPSPENLDGPWFASANFDVDDVLEIMKTVR